MAPRQDSIGFKIVARMKRGRPSQVWIARDFAELGTRNAVDVALHRLEAKDLIRRIQYGLYDLPRIQGDVVVQPDFASVLAAIVRRDGVKTLVDPRSAAERLGLAPETPTRLLVVLTSARLADIPLGGSAIHFRTVATSRLVWAGRPAAYFVQALRYLREDIERGEMAVLSKLRGILEDRGRDAIRKDLERGLGDLPVWLLPHVKKLLRPRRV
jgi:hypothetical protein